ncbi:MAG TPA: glucose-6-phosphate isomerase [Porticoccus sp.]|nr:glucose-6-phosphate isomerase [Porticoccus sp.]
MELKDSVDERPEWQSLQRHKQSLADMNLQNLFAEDDGRFEKFSFRFNDLLYDFSKNLIDSHTLKLLVDLAESTGLNDRINALFSGEPVNVTENRPALHTALRMSSGQVMVNGNNVVPEIIAIREKMRDISERLRAGLWLGSTGKPITTVVNLGVGGSDLGPRMVCQAFKHEASVNVKVLFVSSIDGNEVVDTLKKLNPETTLFIVCSKSFTTVDTLVNAETAKQWLIKSLGKNRSLSNHFIGVSGNPEKMLDFGVDPEHQLPIWDWVGGRYSVWSTVGLSIAISLGMHQFEKFLLGAAEADKHFCETHLTRNIPVIQALISIWYNNFHGASTQVILPYDHRLHVLPAFLQQLEMESNGKGVTLNGNQVSCDTAPIIWGEFGPNAQHAFYQLLHQGTRFVPVEFIAVACNTAVPENHQELALTNCFAQSRALMQGQTATKNDHSHREMPHYHPGNKPSTTILLRELTPENLGSLIAFYEHKVFVQSVIWNINPFDQWGVELGKKLAGQLQSDQLDPAFHLQPSYDDSTLGLIAFVRKAST